jgi:hypothetical protein
MCRSSASRWVDRSGGAEERAPVGAPVGEAADNAISGYYQSVHCRLAVGKRSEQGRPEGAVGFTSVSHERVVVDVVDGHQAIDGNGIVVVQQYQVTRRKRSSVSLAVCHGASPFRFLNGRPLELCERRSDSRCLTPQLLLVKTAQIRGASGPFLINALALSVLAILALAANPAISTSSVTLPRVMPAAGSAA